MAMVRRVAGEGVSFYLNQPLSAQDLETARSTIADTLSGSTSSGCIWLLRLQLFSESCCPAPFNDIGRRNIRVRVTDAVDLTTTAS